MQNIQLGSIGKIAAGLGMTLAELMAGVEQLVANPVERKPSRPRGKPKKTA